MPEPEKSSGGKMEEKRPLDKKADEKPLFEDPNKNAKGTDAAAIPVAPSSGNLVVYVTVGCMLLILPAAGFAVAKYVLGPKLAISQAGEEPGAEAKESSSQKENRPPPSKGGKGDLKDTEKNNPNGFVLQELTVNIAGTRGTRFIRAGLELEASPAVLQELEGKRAQITDIVSTALAAKHLDEMENVGIRQQLREEIMALVNAVLKSGQVSNLFFTDLVIQ